MAARSSHKSAQAGRATIPPHGRGEGVTDPGRPVGAIPGENHQRVLEQALRITVDVDVGCILELDPLALKESQQR